MNKKFFNRLFAYGLVATLVTTNIITWGNPATNFLSLENFGLSIVANAETVPELVADATIVLDNQYLNISGNTVTGLKEEKFNQLLAETGGNVIKITFKPELGIKSISNEVFYSKLNGDKDFILELPETLKTIGDYAFSTNNIVSIKFNPSLTRIGTNAFENSLKLTSLEFNEELKEIGQCAFLCSLDDATTKLKSVKLNDKLQSIRSSAFLGNKELSTVKFGSGPLSIGDGAFSFTALTSLTIESNIKEIESSAFSNIPTLTSVDFSKANPNLVIGDYAFSETALTSVTLEDFMTEIGDGVFYRIPTLKSVDFSKASKLTKIGKRAFLETGLTSLSFTNTIKEIDEGAFSNTPNLKTVDFSRAEALTKIGNEAFLNENHQGITGELILPINLQELGEIAFYGNNISKVKINDNIVSIERGVFKNNAITSIDWGKFDKVQVTVIDTVPDVTYEGVAIPSDLFSDNNLEHVDIPKNVVAMGQSVFSDNKLAGNLIIPASVKYIMRNVFFNNPTDKTLTFETKDGNYGIEIIGTNAFYNSGITGEFTIPNSIKLIGDSAFENNKITGVDFNGIAPILHDDTFIDNPVVSVKRFNTVDSFDDYNNFRRIFYNSKDKSLKNVEFEYTNLHENFNYLHQQAFGESSLRSINLPEQITELKYFDYVEKYNAFAYNKGWYEGDASFQKVALYRIDKNAKYVTDNAVDDSRALDFIINPVLLEFSLKDKDGKDYFDTVSPSGIVIEGNNNRRVELTTLSAIDYKNFKLGDKVTFTLSGALPKGYEFSSSVVKSLGNNKYEFVLDPENADVVKTVAYEDKDYKVGYKKTTISLVPKAIEENNPSPSEPSTPSIPSISEEPKKDEPKKDESKKDEPKKDEPKTTDNTNTSGNNTTPGTANTPSNNTITPNQPNNTVITTVPTINPPTNIPFVPERIVNPNIIPEGNPVFNIVDENDTPLGIAEVNKDEGTYTFIDNNRVPQGVAKIRKDNSLEVLEVFENATPQGKLPITGGVNEGILIFLGSILLCISALLKKRLG